MLNERKLTDGELKKRDEIVKAIKRDRKEENLTDEEVYAIATAQAKKTNEGIMDPYERLKLIEKVLNEVEQPKVPKNRKIDKVDPTLTSATSNFQKVTGFNPSKEAVDMAARSRNPKLRSAAKAFLSAQQANQESAPKEVKFKKK
jgi:cobalamin biosynthesis protein CbiG